jgi:methyl-accepting chemotaxis protein
MISDKLKMGAKDLSKRSESVATGSKIMNDGISSISSCATQSATNLSVLTAAMEEMDATVNEIAKNTGKARTITRTAVDAAESASLKIHALGSEAEEIGQVTEVISEISAQTNLLALNAAIEAARAGAAGRGFAVVATEIKALAGQTDGAARDIAEKIAGIQQSTRGGVTEIGEISNVIRAVDEIVSAISAAVEEQTVTSSQIAQNIAEAVQSVNETNRTITDSSRASARMAADVTGVNVNVQDVTNSSRQVSDNAIKLTEFAAGLKEMISRFKV